MRTKYSLINAFTSLFFSLMTGLLSMVRLKVFISTYGNEINGFFSLSNSVSLAIIFVQAGLGAIFTQKLYALLAKDEKQKIVDLYTTVKRLTVLVTVLIFLLSFGYSFIHIQKYSYLFGLGPTILIYWLYMIPTVVSYYLRLPTYVLVADQKGYIYSVIGESANCASFIFQVIVMLLVPSLNIMIISIIMFLASMAGYIINYGVAMHHYPYLTTMKPSTHYFDKDVPVKMAQSLGASAANSVMTSVDTMMLAYLAPQSTSSSLSLISILTIYNGIISMVKTMIQNMLYQVISSFGNLFNTDNAHFKSIFYSYLKICFILLTSVFIVVFSVINKFVTLFYGSDQLLPMVFLIVIITNALLEVLQVPLLMIPVNIHGNYAYQGKILGAQAISNVVLSYILLQIMGPIGLFIATLIVQFLSCLIFMPLKMVSYFNDSVWGYFKMFVLYTILFVLGALVCSEVFSHILISSMVMWFVASILMMGICFMVIFFISSLVYPDVAQTVDGIVDSFYRRSHA